MATTPNLGLHQWQAGDSFLRTDFNTDFGKIDAAVAAAKLVSPCVAGSFAGDGAANREITLGFRPSLVMLFFKDGSSNERNRFSIYCAKGEFRDSSSYSSVSNTALEKLEFTATGFRILESTNGNISGVTTAYLAIR